MRVSEIVPGLWRWTGLHPDWQAGDDWGREVGCAYYEAPETVVLIDPLVPPEDDERFWTALDRDVERVGLPVAVLLTVDWHARSSEEILERYGGTRAVPVGVDEIRIRGVGGECERLFWLPEHRALVIGDVIHGAEGEVRLCPGSWLPEDLRGEAIRGELRPLLDLPVERILPAHGEPVLANGREALARALGHAQSSSATAT